jgi:hypothetical protein
MVNEGQARLPCFTSSGQQPQLACLFREGGGVGGASGAFTSFRCFEVLSGAFRTKRI